MKIAGDWIANADTQRLLQVMDGAGHRALFVGGCVRNAVLGIAVNDIDIATTALPKTVTNLAKNAGFRVIPTGIAHGTVTVTTESISHEVTTFRRDIETDGRHATVAFSTSIHQDAARRDFTMNALYADAAGYVIDPLGGLPDVLSRRVRFVGDPSTRIREDYLRILRFFRFYAVYGEPNLGIDAEGLAACAANADRISGLSPSRIGGEMRKLLAAADPTLSVSSMAQAGVLARILPGADPAGLGPLVHFEAGLPPRWQRRLAVIGGQNIVKNLCLTRGETVSVGHVRDEIGSGLTAAALGWRLGCVNAQDVILCRAALLQIPLLPDWQQQIDRGARAIMPVMAADLMPGLTGPALGRKLRQIEQRWLESDLTLSHAQLLA